MLKIINFLFILNMVACNMNSPYEGDIYGKFYPKALSLKDPNFKTCVFDSHFPIVHFPMYHFPPLGVSDLQVGDRERIIRSQFQLLHSALAYKYSFWDLVFFEESVASDIYDQEFLHSLSSGKINGTFTRLDGTEFSFQERMKTARVLFQPIPNYYEHLNVQQQEYLLHTGAGLLLYFLGHIPRIHKVISKNDVNQVLAHVNPLSAYSSDNYWVFEFREKKLQAEVMAFYSKYYHPRKRIFIAYGIDHDFSDEFSEQVFQSGHKICLDWDK